MYLVKLPYDELCVVEGSNLLIALSVHNGHSLQAHGLHRRLGGEEKAMVEVVEEFLTGGRGSKEVRGRCSII